MVNQKLSIEAQKQHEIEFLQQVAPKEVKTTDSRDKSALLIQRNWKKYYVLLLKYLLIIFLRIRGFTYFIEI